MSISLKRNIGNSSNSVDTVSKRRCVDSATVNVESRRAAVTSAPITPGRFCAYKAHPSQSRNKSFDLSSSSSSESDEDEDEDDGEFNPNTSITSTGRTRSKTRLRSLRFANMVKSAPVDSTLSRAVAQYSDDDDDDDADNGDSDNDANESFIRYHGRNFSPGSHGRFDYDARSLSSEDSDKTLARFSPGFMNSNHYSHDVLKKRSQSSNAILNVNYSAGRGLLNNKRYSVNIADVVNSLPSTTTATIGTTNITTSINHHGQELNSIGMSHSNSLNSLNTQASNDIPTMNTNTFLNRGFNLRQSGNIPSSDFIARSRCFEYLVGAIDEAWARYCDSTSRDEDIAYGDEDVNEIDNAKVKDTVGESDNTYGINNVALTPSSNTYSTDDDTGYKSNFSETTSVTEYDSDFINKRNNNKLRSFSMINNTINSSTGNRRVSEVPENLRLQGLRDRFTKAKYYLEDLVDSDAYEDCLSFWTKWDLIKYSIVDFVEEDEEDDDIERRIDELEVGRFAMQ